MKSMKGQIRRPNGLASFLFFDIDYHSALCGIHNFNHIKREANDMAHYIANSHSLLDDTHVWHFSLPPALCT